MFKNIIFLFSLLSISLALKRGKFVPCSDPDDFHCLTGNLCINSELECDGKKHCPDGSDESEAHCGISRTKKKISHSTYKRTRLTNFPQIAICADRRNSICATTM